MSNQPTPTAAKLGLFSATSIVVANIIGTGIFTTTGYQAAGIPSHFAILLIWLVGGMLALCGALAYGELASAMPRSGGEYHYLSTLYHPALGFVSGFISLLAGFAAPVAASAMAFGAYLERVWPEANGKLAAIILIALMTTLHSLHLHYGARVQNVFTIIKVGLIVFFIGAGLTITPNPQVVQALPTAADWSMVLSTGFAVSLVYVSYSYSGWNAAAYIAGDVQNPRRNVPRALFLGTLVVITLYVLINFVYLYAAPLADMANKPEVGDVTAHFIFGETGGRIISTFITLALVSSVSSMTMAGPRVLQAIGEDVPALRLMAKHNQNGVPYVALAMQSGIAIVFILTSAFEFILGYIGFTLSLIAALTVGGVYVLRRKQLAANPAEVIRTWGYPFTPALFIALSIWMAYSVISDKPVVAVAGLGTFALGLLLYFTLMRLYKR
jgi:APA family basic amino acid/polyamine antiporter